jgi:hypothetical protein
MQATGCKNTTHRITSSAHSKIDSGIVLPKTLVFSDIHDVKAPGIVIFALDQGFG